MKSTSILISLVITAVTVAGCGSKEASTDSQAPTSSASGTSGSGATVVAYEVGSKKKGDKGVCVVCNKIDGTTAEEEVVETLDYKGKTYVFCNEKEKADFISDPTKFVAN